MELRWSHALIPVKSMREMIDFYTKVLGFKVADRATQNGRDHIVFLSHLEEEHHQLAFLASDLSFDSGKKRAHFAFRTTSLSEVKSLHETLSADDRIGSVSPVTHGNTWSIYFGDPEGNTLEVFCDTPWTVDQPFSDSWEPSDTDEAIHANTLALIKERTDFRPNVR